MKLKSFSLWLLLATGCVYMFLTGCHQNKDGFEETESGLKYKFLKSVDGKSPVPGDVMNMHITYRTDKDSLLFDSRTRGDSFTVVLVEPTFVGGVEEGFAMMSAGDSAQFLVSADSVFEKTFHSQLPKTIAAGSYLKFCVKLNEIVPQAVKDSIERAKDIAARRLEFESIDQYLTANKMDVMPTKNGVYLIITKAGDGINPQPGDSVTVNYTGRLLDNKIFEQKNGLTFIIGKDKVIAGWEEAIPYLSKGAIAKMLIPSDLAYGAQKYGELPPYSSLIFEVEVTAIKKN